MPSLLSRFFSSSLKRLGARFVRDLFNGGSTGLNKLDLRLIDAIRPSLNGYFVELGANDGIRQSNTFKLQRDYGWSGLLIEPSPHRFYECVLNRDFGNRPDVRCAACVPFQFLDRFVEIEDADLMSVARGLSVSDQLVNEHVNKGKQYLSHPLHSITFGALARTLTSLLDEVNAPIGFELLSLDVEGNEISVLKGLDLKKYHPKWILVETRGPEVANYLDQFGYKVFSRLSDYGSYSDVLFRYSKFDDG